MNESEEDVRSRVPEECPFCLLQGVSWDEFEVFVAEPFYMTGKDGVYHLKSGASPRIQVFCTRCNEEIRVEDV